MTAPNGQTSATFLIDGKVLAHLARDVYVKADPARAPSAREIAAALGADLGGVVAALSRLLSQDRVRRVGTTMIDGPTWALASQEANR